MLVIVEVGLGRGDVSDETVTMCAVRGGERAGGPTGVSERT